LAWIAVWRMSPATRFAERPVAGRTLKSVMVAADRFGPHGPCVTTIRLVDTRSKGLARMAAIATVAQPSPRVLADVLPRGRIRDGLLVVGGALLTVLGAQVSVHVPPSPVPITGQTLAVVLAGAALGARRGAASQALYLVLGLFLPVYADGAVGPHVVWGATGGYLIGFVVAAAIIGACAERRLDRQPVTATLAFVAAQSAIFGIGVPWLKFSTGMPWSTAIHDGFTIFIVGGLAKAVIAGASTTAAWRVVNRRARR
jgi:biotin transport system substrate-specific component